MAAWGQQVDPNQWSAYYGYGGAYDAYGYGVVQDPSLYAYGAYSGYTSYPQQVSYKHFCTRVINPPFVDNGQSDFYYLFVCSDFQLEYIG